MTTNDPLAQHIAVYNDLLNTLNILKSDILYSSSISIMNAENCAVLNMDYVAVLPENILDEIGPQFKADFQSVTAARIPED